MKGQTLRSSNAPSNWMLGSAAILLVAVVIAGAHGHLGPLGLMILMFVMGLAQRNHVPVALHDDHLVIRNAVLSAGEHVRYRDIRKVTRPAAKVVELEVAGTAGRPRVVRLRTQYLEPAQVDQLVRWLPRAA